MENKLSKVLIICGPTATGKTSFAISLAQRFNGELISADSRQVYKGMDIITGKDLPPEGIKINLIDEVNPDEEFNVSFWHTKSLKSISDIQSRGKLPIVVGGTGLYIKSLTQNLNDISTSPNVELRNKLTNKTPKELFDYLNSLNTNKAKSMNESDRANPRRLIRAIEIVTSSTSDIKEREKKYDFLILGLTASPEQLRSRIKFRVTLRKQMGARGEYERMQQLYDPTLPSMTASGYKNWEKWEQEEFQYAKRQLTWFRKMPGIIWFNVEEKNWQDMAEKVTSEWYN